ncbi:MAG: VCBS repeat-containing protein, partial [Caldilineaceae bacterium]|nr:VCBS repeat-containing protein [Caldilineaceae bacterium]
MSKFVIPKQTSQYSNFHAIFYGIMYGITPIAVSAILLTALLLLTRGRFVGSSTILNVHDPLITQAAPQTTGTLAPTAQIPDPQLSDPQFDVTEDFIGDLRTTTSIAWADYDQDGDLDLAVGNGSIYVGSSAIAERDQIYQNNHGTFTLIWESDEISSTRAIAWGDYDNDGDVDLLAGCDGRNHLYQNDHGHWRLVWSSDEVSSTQSIAWADYNGDGWLDIAVGNGAPEIDLNSNQTTYRGEPNLIYENHGHDETGKPIFVSVQFDAASEATGAVAWGYYDGDDQPDLAIGNVIGPNRIYQSVVDATRLSQSGSLTQSIILSETLMFAPDYDTLGLTWGDYDGDGDWDLAVANGGAFAINTERNRNLLYRNTLRESGQAGLQLAGRASTLESTSHLAWGDVEGDGRLELAEANLTPLGLSAFGQPNRIYSLQIQSDQTVTLTPMWQSFESDNSLDIAWADYDGDGDLDLLAGNADFDTGNINRLYKNNISLFSPLSSSSISADQDDSLDISWADYDADGRLDVAVANRTQPNRVYHNITTQGQPPTFAPVALPNMPEDVSGSVAWGDADNDGDLDLVFGNGEVKSVDTARIAVGLPNRFYKNCHYDANDTCSGFVLAWSSNDAVCQAQGCGPDWATASVAWADYDGDGDLDLAFGNGLYDPQPNQIFRNFFLEEGVIRFARVWESASLQTSEIAWGDYDKDGDPDLAVANRLEPNQVYENRGQNADGTPRFDLVWQSTEEDDSFTIAWQDVDGDGYLDLAVGNHGQNRIYANNGGHIAQQPTWTSLDAEITTGLAWGDYDNDGDL